MKPLRLFLRRLQGVVPGGCSDLGGQLPESIAGFGLKIPKSQHPLPILGGVVEHGKPLDGFAVRCGGCCAVIPCHEIALRQHLQARHLFQRDVAILAELADRLRKNKIED